MTDDKIERYIPQSEWTPEQHFEHARTGAKPESAEYREARSKALTDAGFEDDNPGPPANVDDWSAADHYDNLRSNR